MSATLATDGATGHVSPPLPLPLTTTTDFWAWAGFIRSHRVLDPYIGSHLPFLRPVGLSCRSTLNLVCCLHPHRQPPPHRNRPRSPLSSGHLGSSTAFPASCPATSLCTFITKRCCVHRLPFGPVPRPCPLEQRQGEQWDGEKSTLRPVLWVQASRSSPLVPERCRLLLLFHFSSQKHMFTVKTVENTPRKNDSSPQTTLLMSSWILEETLSMHLHKYVPTKMAVNLYIFFYQLS